MAAPNGTIEGTAQPAEHVGLPQIKPETFPNQLFWLAITFGLLFLVLWRITLPMISGVIGARRKHIEGDLGTAETLRKDAAGALAGYESALAAARSRALQLADENKKRVVAEVEQLKGQADSTAQASMADAEKRIAGERAKAVGGVRAAAAEAAADIVQRLLGTQVSREEAATAVAQVETKGA
jgi:F-type H+-transporting ATPase subunit b